MYNCHHFSNTRYTLKKLLLNATTCHWLQPVVIVMPREVHSTLWYFFNSAVNIKSNSCKLQERLIHMFARYMYKNDQIMCIKGIHGPVLINTLDRYPGSKSFINSLDQPLINTWLTLYQCLGWHSIYTTQTSRPTVSQVWPNVWIIFFVCFVKKIPLAQWVWGMLWAGQWMSDWVSEFVRDVWNNNQIGATINNQIKLMFVQGESCLWRFLPKFRMAIFAFQ